MKDQETVEPRPLPLLSIFFLIVGIFSFLFLVNQLTTPELLPQSEDEYLILRLGGGIRVNDHAEFTEQIRKDLNTPKEIKLFLSPVVYGLAELRETSTSYIILADGEFYHSISALEQRALLSHELGHVIDYQMNAIWGYQRPSRKMVIEEQIRADAFGAKYTSPDVMIILLDKVFEEYHLRIQGMNKIKQGQVH